MTHQNVSGIIRITTEKRYQWPQRNGSQCRIREVKVVDNVSYTQRIYPHIKNSNSRPYIKYFVLQFRNKLNSHCRAVKIVVDTLQKSE